MPKVFDASENQAQADFLLSQARVVGYIGGVGSGKTAGGAVKAVRKIQDKEDGIIVAPDFPQFAKSTWPEFLKWAPMGRCTNANLDHPYTQKKFLTFNISGKEVIVYYGGIEDERSWAGPNVNWCWFDEGGRKQTRDAFNILLGRIRIGQNPQLWVTTTPNGISHWLYDVFYRKLFDDKALTLLRELGYKGPVVEYFHGRTEDNKKNLDPFYYAAQSGLYSGKLREQELEGAFVTLEGAVWDMFDPTPGGPNVSQQAEYRGGVPIEWWVDDGFTEGHPRVILMAQVIPPNLHVFDEYVVVGELAEVSFKRALEKCPAHPTIAYVDSSAAELRSRLWQMDIDTVSATHDVVEGIKRTASWIQNGKGEAHLIFHPRCEFSLRELPAYSRSPKTQQALKKEDNASDAMRYGVWPKDREEIWGEKTPGEPLRFFDTAHQIVTVEQEREEVYAESIDVPRAMPNIAAQYLRMWGNPSIGRRHR